MTTPRYLPVAELKVYIRGDITADDTLLEEAINVAEQTLDNACGRRFVVASASTARVYVPQPATTILFIDDATAVTVVSENGTTLVEGTGYQLEPLNGISDSGEAIPYTQIRRLDNWWYRDGPEGTISVTATYGWAAIPALIKEACKVLAKDALENREVRHGLVAVVDGVGGVGSRDNKIVREAVRSYRSSRSWGIA